MSDKFQHLPVDDVTYKTVENSLNMLWRVVNDLSHVRPPKPNYYRVTIFGSARIESGHPLYEEVRTLACRLSAAGCDIVTGGGPGLMQAANEGENEGDPENVTRSIGLPVKLPHEEEANPFVEKLFKHQTFFSRLHQFVRLSSAFVVVKGGIGTTLETLMIWQLLQVRHIHDLPLILVGDMWRGLVDWSKTHMLSHDPQFADPEDLNIPVCVDTIEEAIERVLAHKAASFDAPRAR